jgi:hypothetical protein
VKQFLLLGVLLLASAAWAGEQNLVLTGQSKVLRVQVDDRVNIVGDSNRVEIQGDCASLELVGNSNQVRVDGQVPMIQVVGSGNLVQWVARSGRQAPSLQSLGSNNQLVPIQP